MFKVFVVSDGTGETAERVVQSALVQFEEAQVELIRRGDIGTPERVRELVQEAAGIDSLIVHTLVSNDLRRLMLSECRVRNVDSLDVMGPVLDRLAHRLQLEPQEKPGLFQQLEEARTREIEAVEYAFHHDDGQNVDDLERAEVVLVGISRTMKTPIMLYLGYRGWFAANVPLVPDLPIQQSLTKLAPERVFYLAMSPSQLLELRRIRAVRDGIPMASYASAAQISKEVEFAERLQKKYGWQRVEVSGKSVEEIAREIISTLSGPVG
jgi:regulator of PEP synthase PpsR (kinase-PPPase family)